MVTKDMTRSWGVEVFAGLALLTTLLTLPVTWAGSTAPNPKALAPSAAAALEEGRKLQAEMDSALARLAKDPNFTKDFDDAAFKNDQARMVALLRAAGARTGDLKVQRAAADILITITYCGTKWCLTVYLRW